MATVAVENGRVVVAPDLPEGIEQAPGEVLVGPLEDLLQSRARVDRGAALLFLDELDDVVQAAVVAHQDGRPDLFALAEEVVFILEARQRRAVRDESLGHQGGDVGVVQVMGKAVGAEAVILVGRRGTAGDYVGYLSGFVDLLGLLVRRERPFEELAFQPFGL